MAIYQQSLSFEPLPPFDFSRSLSFLSTFTTAYSERALQDGALRKAFWLGGRTVLLEFTAGGSVEEPRLDCHLFAGKRFSKKVLAAAEDRAAFYLSAGDDLRPFYQLALKDPVFAQVVNKLYGYHQVKFATPLEAVCSAILAQHLALPAAKKMKRALVERCGNRLELEGVTYRAFPDGEQLSALSDADLAAAVPNQRKASYLKAAAEAMIGVEENWLRSGDYQQVKGWLEGAPGIGDWSALFILIRGLGRMDEVQPDAAALRAAGKVYGRPVDEAEFIKLAQGFGPWQGYWMLYLRTYSAQVG